MIALLVPLLGRPSNVRKMIKEWEELGTDKSELLFAIEPKDSYYDELKEIIKDYRFIEGEWDGVCPKLQAMYEAFKDDKFTIYHGGADDVTYSKDFDKEILEELDLLEKKTGHRVWVLYGNDHVHGQKLCTHWFVTKEYAEAIGYFTPDNYMKHCHTDVTFMVISTELGILRYIPWVDTHHHSWANGEAEKDDNYKIAYSEERLKNDQEMFQRWVQEHGPMNYRKLSEAINAKVKN